MRFPRFSPDKESNGQLAQPLTPLEPSRPEVDDAVLLARAIHRAGMSAPALFVMSALKPLHWLGGQAVWMLQPFIESLGMGARSGRGIGSIGAISSSGIARLLERENGLVELEAHLDNLRAGREPQAAQEAQEAREVQEVSKDEARHSL